MTVTNSTQPTEVIVRQELEVKMLRQRWAALKAEMQYLAAILGYENPFPSKPYVDVKDEKG